MALKIFCQLYVIRAPLDSSAVTCAYAFLPSKSQAVYEEMMQAIVTKCDEIGISPDPQIVTSDFEQAMMQAVKAVFGQHVETKGCLFHLMQSTWRKVQELGLVQVSNF
jgi:hypothetical protein